MRKTLLLLFFALVFASFARAQERTVSGRVTATEDGSSLPGVNVLLKGTSTGTVTDSDGNYKLTIPADGGSLVFSFIGLQTTEIPIGDRTVVDISLGLDVTQLSEVVVTGVGVATDKRRLAISVESVSGDKLPALPSASIDQALVGKIAGAQIMSASGNPGTPVSIQLRGINTLSGGTQPLIMVDGVQMQSTALNSLDLSNVERIEVVQGASAATIYGAQGANGVIQIFTKKGKAGKMKINFGVRTSSDRFLNVGDLRQAKNHSFSVDGNGDMVDTDGNLLEVIPPGFWAAVNWENGAGAKNERPYQNNTQWYDHVDQVFNSASTSNASLAISGGKENSDYAFSIAKLKQESVIQGQLDRTNFTANVGFEIAKGLTFRSTTQLIYSNNTSSPFAGGGAEGGYLSAAFYTWPFADFEAKDSQGNYLYKFGGAGTNSVNPLYGQQFQKYDSKTLDVLPSLNLNYKINPIFELDYKLGLNYSNNNFARNTLNQTLTESYAYNDTYYSGSTPNGQLQQSNTQQYNVNSLASAIMKLDFDKDLNLKLPITSTTQVSFDWRKSTFHRTYSTYTGLPVGVPIDDINGAQTASNASSEYLDEFITYGYLLNQRFEYKDIASVSGGFRSDFSSVFGEANKPFTFPRADGYLRLSKLGFWEGISNAIPEFKIRAAYGEAGIQPVVYNGDLTGSQQNWAGPTPNHYPRTTTLKVGTADGLYWYDAETIGNKNLKVERTAEFEYGFDFGVSPFKSGSWLNYISANVSVWNRKSTGVVWAQPLAISSGAGSIYTNYIDLSSNGVQFSLDMDLYNSANLTWDFNTVFGTSKSFVDKTLDGNDIPLTYISAGTYTLKPGQQVGTVYGYKALTSIDQKDTDGNFYLDQSQTANYEIVKGRVVDKTSKRVEFTSDKYALGNTTPKFNMAFTNTFAYKNYLNVSFQIDWVYGAKTYNQTKEWMYSEGLHRDYDDELTINGESGAWTAYYRSFYDAIESNGTKDFFLENSSFARLRNVSVAFDIAKFFNMEKINTLQLVLSGRNLATITNYTGFDPEASQNTAAGGTGSAAPQNATQRGLDFWTFPNFKSYQVGLNVSF